MVVAKDWENGASGRRRKPAGLQMHIKALLANPSKRRVLHVVGAVVVLAVLVVSPFILYMSQWDLYTLRLTGKYRRVLSEQEWEHVEAAKAALPKDPFFQSLTAEQLQKEIPVRVISLRRAVERRQEMVKQLTGAGIRNYEIVDAVDGRNESLTEQDVKKYVNGVRLKLWKQRHSYQLGKVAADLSHYRELERVVAENKPAIIMEDDVIIPTKNFYADLLEAVKELPQDWQVLDLLACHGSLKLLSFGRLMGNRIAVMRGGVCIPAYLVNPAGAKVILDAGRFAADRRLGPVTDFLYHFLLRHRDLQMYICKPFLVNFAPSHDNSLIPYKKMYEGMWPWDIPWI